MTNTTRAEIAGGAPTGPTQALVLDLREVDRTRIGLVGGKGANLGELSRLAEVRVPAGVCVTTAAFRRMLAAAPAIAGPLERLAGLAAEDRAGIRELSDELRRIVEATELPADVEAALTRALTRLGAEEAHAVRSSATAEDLPGASFAGQQDTFLNVRGVAAIRAHVRRCWASLFSERAVAYRIQHGFDHREAHMAVVIQRMVFAQAAGVLFTADPVTSNRKVAAIEACFGLGEALVGGQASADRYAVRDARILERAIASKERAVDAAAAGGTADRAIEPERRTAQVLTDAQIVRLAQLGRSIEAHFGQPQDIEWCLVDDVFHIVQSRPITTLYPIPEAHDGGNHVYLSVGHQQMMTDAMKPLGLSVRQMTSSGPMHAAGGRLFADATRQLASAASRDHFLNVLGRADPLVKDALTTLLARGDFLELAPAAAPTPGAPPRFGATVDDDPAVVGALIERSELELAELRREIQGKTGTALLECVRDDLDKLRRSLADPRNLGVIMAGMDAAGWLNEHLLAWLGEKNAADVLSQSLADNVTSRMGLDLLAVADVIRPWPDVVAYLERATGDDFLAGLAPLAGGPAARDAIQAFLDRYGMRCAGEIDITRPRWREQPASLIPVLLGNVKNCEPHAGERRFEQGRQAALTRARTLLERVRRLPDGESKADETRRMIDRLRNFSGYREYPKYAMVQRYFVHRQALLQEAGRLVQAGVIRDVADIDYLTFDELREVVRTQSADLGLVDRRRAAHALHERLSPPRVITSEGEVLAGAFRRDGLPAGALVGLAVSSGVVEGRARVVLDMAAADLQAGDILVTTFTDPSWTPLFVAIRGLVTEVGGLMTHGAVIAREYGLPAVVSVAHATRRIRDGQHIRVNGSDGYVETLTE